MHKIHWHIAILYVLLISLLVIGLNIFITGRFNKFYFENLDKNLIAESKLISSFLNSSGLLEIPGSRLDSSISNWSQSLNARITIIDENGNILAESDDDKETMDNHLNRPEIVQAINEGAGKSIRYSTTIGKRFYYFAVSTIDDNNNIYFVRLAIPLEDIDAYHSYLHRLLLISTVISLLISVVFGIIISKRITMPIQELTEVANLIIHEKTDLAVLKMKSIHTTFDELQQLIHAFQTMVMKSNTQISAMNSSEKKIQTILETITDGLIVTDKQDRIQMINPAALRIFDIADQDPVGQSLLKIIRHHEIAELLNQSKQSKLLQSSTVEFTTKNVILNCVVTPLINETAYSTLFLFQDLTRLKQLEVVRKDFISNISHELRTPLASLKALTDTLLEVALEDSSVTRHFLQRMETEVDSLNLIVSELIELTRIESGQIPLKMALVNPLELVEQAVERLRLQAERANLEIFIHSESKLQQIYADFHRLEQVLVNLLHNAIKFSPDGGNIQVKAEEKESTIIFSVADNGIGIPSEDLSRIFERFYKTDKARSTAGTGLGLAIARHIVENHKGKIWAESVEGEGSTFYFSIPIAN